MAFPDWPTSDGHGMFAYPWLASTGAKFLEHGHRLAGILIGLSSLLLAAVLWFCDSRVWVRRLGLAVVGAVVVQGILGGQRVLLDARGLAFIHGSTAALVFVAICAVPVVTSREWLQPRGESWQLPGAGLAWLAVGTVVTVYVQYVLGGLVRHQGRALLEHLGFAFVAALMAILFTILSAATAHPWLKLASLRVAVLTLCQLLLGAGTWITKYGFGDRVAVYGSTEQVAFRTAHVLTGMFLFASVFVLALRVLRLRSLARLQRSSTPAELTVPHSAVRGVS